MCESLQRWGQTNTFGWLWPENEVRSYQGKWAITDTERRFWNAIYVTPSAHIEFNSPWDLGGLSPVYECSSHPRESVWQILCKLSLLGQTHPQWLCRTVPLPQYCKKVGNDLLSFSCYFLLLRDEAHLISPVVISLVQLENSGTLETVHDVHLSLHIPPADKLLSIF